MKTPRQKAEEVLDAVCERHGITREMLLGPYQRAPIMAARRAAIKEIARVHPDWKSRKIARVVRRDHSTVNYHLGKRRGRKNYIPADARN
jgi:chromosomal replication initiation ATPase DnaA